MADNIYFFKVSKRPNSTYKPNINSGDLLICKLKDACSVMAPVIEVHMRPNGSTPGTFEYNYCYIQDFGRWYFIDDVVRDQNVWVVRTHVDVLATYKSDITGSSQYIVRSAGAYDADLIDSYYVTKANKYAGKIAYEKYAGYLQDKDMVQYSILGTVTSGGAPYFNKDFSSGQFVIGVVGDNTTGTTFYAMSFLAFKDFIQKAFALNPSDMSDVSTGIANAVFDPISYVTMCRWYPSVEVPSNAPTTNQPHIGRYYVTLSAGYSARVLSNMNTVRYYAPITIPRHPDSSTRPYLNLAPFSEYNLYFEPFGSIPIDASKIYGQTSLNVQWTVDYCAGLASLQIRPWDSGDEEGLIYSTTSEYGVPIPISALSYDWKAGAFLSAAQFIKSQYESGITRGRTKPSYMTSAEWSEYTSALAEYSAGQGNGFMNVVNGVMDITASALGQVVTQGSSGSFLAYNTGVPVLYAWFQLQTGFADAKFGRPLEQYRAMSGLSGFVLCENAAITSFSTLKPLMPEYNMIMQYLNTGVYIE